MTYMVRERPDGQVEIVVTRATLVGVFPERGVAERVCVFLQEEEIGWPEEKRASSETAAADVAEAEGEVLDERDEGEAQLRALVDRTREDPAPVALPVRNLPAVAREVPRPPAILTPQPAKLTEEEIAAAFHRLAGGERLTDVALDIGVPMGQLRGLWAQHKKSLQRYMAEGGQQPCSICAKPFTPSVSSPDKCARCSDE